MLAMFNISANTLFSISNICFTKPLEVLTVTPAAVTVPLALNFVVSTRPFSEAKSTHAFPPCVVRVTSRIIFPGLIHDTSSRFDRNLREKFLSMK